ncbi:acyl-CoA-binding protein [Marinicella pacifica]|jgi:acyl-CoA-binding protein|uniref:Acyl-CoA-binding protein n=1 Tax=Marinicella pacifica TaxID=1171543 RepID=A0A917CKE9_9GAMM|nr:acyl-CoA-binding protein [Marinicella pacifica]GGF91566.1 acyl-CoA-binding protein [Marinicella pacifica]
MSELDDAFANAQNDVKKLPHKPDDATLLKLYAYYKQGSVGDVHGDKPGFFDFVGAAKYEAWEKTKGMSQDEAKQHYIDLVNKLTA